MKTHTITVELTDYEVHQIRQHPDNPAMPRPYDRHRAFGTFLNAVLALPEPLIDPQVGDTVQPRGMHWHRLVVAVDGEWVYLSPPDRDLDIAPEPICRRLADFHASYEVMS